jgi:hypothetical protein
LAAGCTSLQVRSVDGNRFKIVHICIQENPKVIVSDFLQVLRDRIEYHGLTTQVFSGDATPHECEYALTYTARQSSDFSPYLSEAQLDMRRGNELIGRANYHLRGKGGFSLTKWAGTASKMNLLCKFALVRPV